MKNYFIKIFALFLTVSLLGSCIEDVEEERIFKDRAQVEFKATAANVNYSRLTKAGAGVLNE